SESDQNISDNEIKSESDDDKNFDDNSNTTYLNNFEYIDNPNNYIEDKIYDDIKLKVRELFKKEKCTCRSKCLEKIGYEQFLARRIEFESLDKNTRNMVIKGQLIAFQKDENTNKVTATDRKYIRFNYCYNNSLPICRATYEALVGVSHNYIDSMIQHLKKHGLEERIHGNTGKSPKNMKHRDFYASYISSKSYSYASVYRDYIQAFKVEHKNETRIIAESTFTKLWKTLIPLLQFMSPKSDLCEVCETMKLEIQYTTEHEKKIEITENYLKHLNRAKQERDYYNANIKLAIDDSNRNSNNLSKTKQQFKSFEGCAHIAYDWAQNLLVPYSPQQIGSLFFKSSRKVHLFGVCNIGNYPHTEQTNYTIDEAEMPNDRQNKNNYSLFFYSWLIDRGIYDEIELNFMIPGHTKFICNSCFGLIKILYRKSKVNTVDDVISIINHSTLVNLNTAQCYLNGYGFQYYNFKVHFQNFKKLSNIQSYQHFYFTSQHPRVVFYKDKIEDDYKNTTIRSFFFDSNIFPQLLILNYFL
ncbi:38540_t:CDS:2, partial [Gigaspora margarita]